MNKILKIGTRDSDLAIYQAKKVQKALKILGKNSELKLIFLIHRLFSEK